MENITLDMLMLKLALLAVIVERANAQIKAIWKTDLFGEHGPAKPWPLIALVLAGVPLYGYDAYVLTALFGHEPTNVKPLVKFCDWAISTLTAAGGAAGVIDMMKSLSKVGKHAKAATQ